MTLSKKTYYSLIVTILSFCFNYQSLLSQDGFEERFLIDFKKQNNANKVLMFDTLKRGKKLDMFPLIKDELQKIKLQAQAENKTDILDKLYKIEGELFYLKKNYSKAIPIFKDLLTKKKIRTYSDSALILHYLKKAYVHIHSLNKAIEIHRVLERLKQSHPDIDPWLLHPKLSSIYFEMNLFKQALDQQLLEYTEIEKTDHHMYLGYFNNRGLFWNKYGNYDSAICCYKKARSIFEANHLNKKLTKTDEFTLCLIEGNIGQAYMELKQYEKAIPLLKKDVIGSINSENFLNAAVSEIELAKCYLHLKQLTTSKKYLDLANERLLNIDDYKSKLEVIKQYAVYYDKAGLPKLSINYFNQYINLRDSFEKEQNLKEVIAAHVANQITEKENLINDNQKKIEQKNKEVLREKIIRNSLLVSGVLLIMIIIVIAYQLIKVNTQKKLLELKNKKIKTRNSIINKSLAEKDLLVKEVHHRVKNNLQIVSSLLKLQTLKTTNKDIQVSLGEAQDRINSMAVLHQLLYKNNQMTRLSFKDYLTTLISQISSSFNSKNKHIEMKVKLIELELDIDTAIPLGLITNEIMSNAYKHAFSELEQGVINIELGQLTDNTYFLKISDNGVGIPADFDLSSIESLGLDIVSILSEQIDAELKIFNNNGAHFEIVFKG